MKTMTLNTLVLAGVCSMLPCGASFAQSPSDEWRPALFLSATGESADDVRARVVEASSDCVVRGALSALADTSYAAGPRFQAAAQYGAAGMAAIATKYTDECLADAVQGSLGTTLRTMEAGATVRWGVNFRWIRESELPAGWVEAIPMSSAEKAIMMWRSIAGPTSYSGAVDYVRRLRVYWPKDVGMEPALPDSLPIDAYHWLAQGAQSRAAMVSFDMSFEATRDRLQSDWNANMKPAVVGSNTDDAQGGLKFESLEWHPAFYGTSDPSLMRLSMSHGYPVAVKASTSANDVDPLSLDVKFGVLKNGQFTQCAKRGCEEMVYRVPTLVASPDLSSVSRTSRVMRWLLDSTGTTIKVFFLFNTLKIDLRDPDGLAIMYAGSNIPVVGRFKTPYGDVTRMIMDETTSILGVKVYDRLVGDSLITSLTPKLRDTIKTMDDASAAVIAKVAASIPW